MGFSIVTYTGACILTVIHTLKKVLSELYNTGSVQKYADFVGVLKEHNDLINMPFYKELEKKYVHGIE